MGSQPFPCGGFVKTVPKVCTPSAHSLFQIVCGTTVQDTRHGGKKACCTLKNPIYICGNWALVDMMMYRTALHCCLGLSCHTACNAWAIGGEFATANFKANTHSNGWDFPWTVFQSMHMFHVSQISVWRLPCLAGWKRRIAACDRMQLGLKPLRSNKERPFSCRFYTCSLGQIATNTFPNLFRISCRHKEASQRQELGSSLPASWFLVPCWLCQDLLFFQRRGPACGNPFKQQCRSIFDQLPTGCLRRNKRKEL